MFLQTTLNEIIRDLSDNFRNDTDVLESILRNMIADALFISNRKDTDENKKILASEIKTATKSLYLLRGTEGNKSLSEMGTSTSFDDVMDKLRKDIVKNGKRVVF